MKRPITGLLALSLTLLSGATVDASAATDVRGMDIYQLAVAHGDVVFGAGEIDALVVSSADLGKTWKPAQRPPELDTFLLSVVTAPDGALYGASPYRIYRSTDQGAHWTRVKAGMPFDAQITRLTAAQGQVYAMTQDGLFRVVDAGTKLQLVSRNFNFQSLAVSADKTMIGVTENFLVRSADQGRTWQTIEIGMIDGLYHFNHVVAVGDDVLLAANYAGVYKSRDGGRKWVWHNQGIPKKTLSSVDSLTTTRDGTVFMGIDGILYRSDDKGDTWAPSNKGLPQVGAKGDFAGPRIWTLAEASNGALFVGTRVGVFKSDDKGRSWKPALTLVFTPGVSFPH